ncbi:MAG TPA: aminotransferase class I/II-fold pyridoxal phosphate-dependent enzyme [Sphingobium sp.]|uniref:aminotransferase class I/II-fold pyridoxal phosphate-dependent enzyme n=1 Tax=Sphingobium sp. TaxID=1912891 RepID=UPI002ED42A09
MSRFTWHGGGLEAARARFGDSRGEGDAWIDLSTGINPAAWPVPADLEIDWQRLPSLAALAALEAAAAKHFGVDPAFVCAVPGTEVGLRLAGTLLPEPARYLTPCYRTHGELFGTATPIARADWRGEGEGTTILANPNNPDGDIVPRERLMAAVAQGSPTNWLVVDEAFADPDPSVSIAALVSDERPLAIFRSFGKFFGLAGVRLGFVIGPRPLVDRFRARLGAWPVSAAAIAIGTAAYRDRRWIAQAREQLHNRALALDVLLRRAGYKPRGECPLFRLIEVADGHALFERLAERHILTRPFDEQPRWLRLGLPDSDADYDRLAQALAYG